ncbi:MAG TPA: hypothetical protein RMH99_10095 [Sandaracinaceae bacterium LLY-WYZ-13_1]|nr:hypothetical protein [Sandaracinaceae bacterium LLY-WYZ-13_1]
MVRALWLLLAIVPLALAPRGAAAQLMEDEQEAQPGATDEPRPAERAASEPEAESEGSDAEAGPSEDETAEGALETTETEGAEGTAVTAGGGYEPDQRGTVEEDAGGDAEPAPEPMSGVEAVSRDEAEAYGLDRPFGASIQLWLGAGLTSLDALDGDNLVRESQRGGFGGSFRLSVGARLGPVTVGPRVGLTVDESLAFTTFGLDVQLRLTGDAIAPFVRTSVSYAFVTGVANELPSQDQRIDGVLIELGAGARIAIDGPFHLGAELSGGYLHLERGAAEACDAECTAGDLDVTRPGTSDGLTLRVHVFGGVSF